MKKHIETLEKKIFEASNIFSTRGNGQFGNIIRTGWSLTKLGKAKQDRIHKALIDSDVDQVYRKGSKIYKSLLNGNQVEI